MKTNWEVKKLGEILIENKKSILKSKDNKSGVYPFFVSGFNIKNIDQHLVDGKNIFLPTGGNFFVHYFNGKAAYSTDTWSIKTKENIDIKFLYYFLIFNQNFIGKKLFKGATIKHLQKNDFRNIEILLPLLSEQKRIVAILDEAFAAIAKAKANTERNLKNAKELFESYLQEVFENKGEGWEEKRLEEICFLISKGSSPKWQGIKYIDEPGVLFVTSENVGENTLLLEQRKYVEEKFNISDKKSILKNGDVLTNIVGASIGRTAIFDLDDIANINQAVCLIRCNQELLFNEYLMYLLNSPFTKQHLHDNEVNNARANLSLGFFRNLSIPLPKLAKQKEVVNKIKVFHIEIKKLEAIYQQKIKDLEELKKSVLQKAFNGGL